MNTDDALSFLRMHQPMPADAEMSDEEFEQYARVRRYLQDHPTVECIPLLLNSFGEGDGHGLYQLVEDVINQFPKDIVLPHLREALASPYPGVRSWSAEIAEIFPDPSLIQPLAVLLNDSDVDVRTSAAAALAKIPSGDAVMLLQAAKAHEQDDDAREFLQMLLDDLSKTDGSS